MIDTTPLFRPLLGELLFLLRGLSDAQWGASTVAGAWRVRDVAAHLLDGDLRRLAASRDGHRLAITPPTSEAEVSALVNGLNAGGVSYAQRLSPRLIVDLLEMTGGWVADLFASLPPDGSATFPVSWAGERSSRNWMDIGRDYTERWHHQMQIRDAVGVPRLLEPRWMLPFLDISAHALPHAYRDVAAPPSTTVTFQVTGATAAAWSIVREGDAWRLARGGTRRAQALVTADADAAWRLLFNALTPPQIVERVRVEGDLALAAPLLRARAVVL
jgi:uncharacterized protein (TIGR03083 family)